jgi:hypothetical protein
MLHTSNILWQWITVKETGFAGVRLLSEDNFQTSEHGFVLDFLQQSPERNVLEILLGSLVKTFHALLPTVVLANDDRADAMLDTVLHDELGRMVEVVLQPEISLPTLTLRTEPVEVLVDAFANATVDQYGSCLV